MRDVRTRHELERRDGKGLRGASGDTGEKPQEKPHCKQLLKEVGLLLVRNIVQDLLKIDPTEELPCGEGRLLEALLYPQIVVERDRGLRRASWDGFRSQEGGMTTGTYQLQPEIRRGELNGAHGALSVDEHGALESSC